MVLASTDVERWGDFILAQDPAEVMLQIERPGRRQDLVFSEDEGPFDSRFSKFSTDLRAATADARVPLLQSPPADEPFFGYTIVEDAKGTAEAWVHYLRPEFRQVPLFQGPRPALPDDATIVVGWSLRYGAPFPVIPVTERNPTLDLDKPGPAVLLDQTFKVEVNGNKGIMRTFFARRDGSTYPFRIHSVLIQWFEADVLWTFWSYFLSPEQALQLAESIRPVTIK